MPDRPADQLGARSLVWKLTGLLLAIALVPFLTAVLLGASRSTEAMERFARDRLEEVARTTATRLDQLLLDHKRAIERLAREHEIVGMCRAEAPTERQRSEARDELALTVASSPDIASAFATDAHGVGLASTNPRNIGQDLTFREYWKEARAGHTHISSILVGKTSGEAGVYLSTPVRDTDSTVIGVAVMKLDAKAIRDVIAAVRIEGGEPVSASAGREAFQGGHAVLTDAHGVILAHPLSEALYTTLLPIDTQTLREIDPERRWGVPTVELTAGVGIPELGAYLASPRAAGSVRFHMPSGEAYIGGYAPMSMQGWVVSVVEPEGTFFASIHRLRDQQLVSVVVIVGLTVIIAVIQARHFIRPIRALTGAARRISEGDFEARADVRTHDEIGVLAGAFNRMVPRLRDELHMRHALDLARQVQRNLLPAAPPGVPGIVLAGTNIPADQTGGDYYDYLTDPARPHRLRVVIGDVTGHGVAPALLMAGARALVRAHACDSGDLGSQITRVNAALSQDVSDGRFMTLLIADIDTQSRTVRFVSAGHDPIIVFDPDADAFHQLEGGGIPLGVLPDQAYTESSSPLPPSAMLVLGTDGVWEARNTENEMFGKDRFRRIIRAHAQAGPQRIIDETLAELRHFRGAAQQADDITIIVARLTPG